MKRAKVVVVGALLFGAAVRPAQSVDVPTWQVGDWWDMTRTFEIEFNTTDPIEMAVNLATTENYRLTVAAVEDLATTDAGTVRVYRRTRSGGTVSGQGTVILGGLPLDLRWKQGATSSGDDWTAVADLSEVHDHFVLEGSLETRVIFWQEIAAITLEASIDFSPPRESPDFPLATVGEQWRTTVTQHLYGRIRVRWNPDFPLWSQGTPPDDIDKPFDISHLTGFSFTYAGEESHGSYAETHRIEGLSGIELWYAPAIKEFAEKRLPEIDLGGGNRLSNVSISVTNSGLSAEPDLHILAFDPPRPFRGGWVEVLGSTSPNTTVRAIIPGEGSGAEGRADPSGRFALWLHCPDHDDHTPSTDDEGSFGVEVSAEGIGRKVATIQLEIGTTRARRTWELYR